MDISCITWLESCVDKSEPEWIKRVGYRTLVVQVREDVGFGPVVAPKEEQKEEKEEEEQQQIGPRGETFGGCFMLGRMRR